MESLKEILNKRKFSTNYYDEFSNQSDYVECEICDSARWIIVNKQTVPCSSCQQNNTDEAEINIKLMHAGLSQLLEYDLKKFQIDGRIGKADPKNLRKNLRIAEDYSKNPMGWLLISGEPGTGKTHFISAIGDSLQSVMPHRSIFRIDGSTLENCPSDCEEAFRQAGAILVDDIHEIIIKGIDDSLGRLLHIAIDHGIQIICTSRSLEIIESVPTSNLRQVLTGSAIGTLEDPSIPTLIAYLRRRSIAEGASIDEEILSSIVLHSPTWVGSLNALQIVLSSISEGFIPVDDRDVSILLEGRSLSPRTNFQSEWNPDLVGKKLVEEVLDDVLPKGFDPNVELDSNLNTN